MIQKGDRVRYSDKDLDLKYGVMEVWEIKGDNAICRYGDFHSFDLVTVKLAELTKE